MKILVLGGTRFVGRHIVEALLERGYAVSIFNRGRHPNPFEEVEQLVGDRDGDLSALAGRRWDRVIDVSGYTAPQLRRSTDRLAGAAEHYTFVSTVSVYLRPADPPIREDSPLLPPEAGEDAGYGEGKVAAEAVVREAFPDRHLIVRPGILAGPHDYTDRFTWWALRIRRGGDVLAPGDGDQPVQLIDARDLAEWIGERAREPLTGTFNAVGPADPLTMRSLLERIRNAAETDARFVWVENERLHDAGATPGDLPFWAPGEPTVFMVSGERAVSKGLRHRSLETTIRDTVAWIGADTDPGRLSAGMSGAKERKILSATGS